MLNRRFALIGGAGKIGTAILNGMVEAGAVRPENVVVTARHERSLARSRPAGVAATTDNRSALREADIVMLCVHPTEILDVLDELRGYVGPGQLLVSVVTGVSTKIIEARLGEDIAVIRAMPNTAVHVGQSMTSLSRGHHVSDESLTLAHDIFATVGEVEILDEKHFNAATGLGGCGPAFVFKIIEALSEGGVKVGLPREAARKMAAQVLKGAAEMVLRTGMHPAALKDEVTTPGGCTIDGIAKLEEHGISIALINAVETSTRKAGQLDQG